MLKWMIKEDYYDIERLRHFYHENLDEHLALHSIKVPKMFRVPRSPNSREELIQELLQKKKKKKKKKTTEYSGNNSLRRHRADPIIFHKKNIKIFIFTFVDDYSRNS